ncbi:MAG: MCE family protein [Gemmatimonadetes bacterium]|nr:MCE family protein [Gemmatimonadota bacterium]
MNKRRRNLMAIGILTVLSTIVFFWGLYWLLGTPVLRGGMDVVVKLENGGGVKRSDRVQLQGVEVGSVRSIRLSDRGGVIAVLRLDRGFALPSDSRADVQGDVFGAHTVILTPGRSLVAVQDGDTIGGGASPQLTDMAAGLSTRADSVLSGAAALLSAEAVRDVHATVAELPESAGQLRAAFMELRAAAASLRRSTEGLERAEAGASMARAINAVEQSAHSLSAAASNMDTTLAAFSSVMAKIDRGAGTLGLLVNDSSLFREWNETLREVRALATDIRQRPNRYIDLKIF